MFFRPVLFLITTIVFFIFMSPILAGKPHVINLRSPNLFPESLAYDPKAQHFIVGSLRHPTLLSVSDAGVSEPFISDHSLPVNSSFLGVAVDSHLRRLLAVVHNRQHSSNFLAAYDLPTRRRLFLTPLPDDENSNPASPALANDVAVDFSGNAYVTNSGGNFIWKVTGDGEASIFSRSPVFKKYPVDGEAIYHASGLNGVVYISKGYLLVVQSNTGKLFKVSVDDGQAKTVILNRDLTAADGIAVRSDGVVVVVSHLKVHYIKSADSWSEGVVFDETALDVERFASSVTVGEEDRVYVLYGHVDEGFYGHGERDDFGIVEIRSEQESKEEPVWIFVLIGLGLAYFLFWRFQMRQLMTNMDKKRA